MPRGIGLLLRSSLRAGVSPRRSGKGGASHQAWNPERPGPNGPAAAAPGVQPRPRPEPWRGTPTWMGPLGELASFCEPAGAEGLARRMRSQHPGPLYSARVPGGALAASLAPGELVGPGVGSTAGNVMKALGQAAANAQEEVSRTEPSRGGSSSSTSGRSSHPNTKKHHRDSDTKPAATAAARDGERRRHQGHEV